ncbi:peptidase [Paenibacillus darwinianus]|uniref:Germination protease n=1 Tax=Paenibacillus darwinianus TaxID=1380763 RepID=A0A9W5W7H8_9BACL|nr:GPR endopeptidase [Paenibacillus darwinianus]EXX87996.1 peptidase [Paenibacillus darwinianus]EXX88054.1 peptidase [Paenibacillus darwinianus]EXX89249.1 peptidase [Paenibacillus darwinianus]
MEHELDLRQYNVRTDLALEAKELAEVGGAGALQGVRAETVQEEGITITRMSIDNEIGARAIGKMIGQYVTLEVPGLRNQDTVLQDRVATVFAREFEAFLQRLGVGKNANTLIVGLGNWNVTPDALGPLVVENTMVTRHYFELMPDRVAPGYRPVSAVAPGVLGITGIESSEIVQGIVQRTKPDLIIAIDALASKAIERVNTTIQIADTGIHPGSGIGNKRKGLTQQILGVPVIAIGVPTVVYASTIVNSCIELLSEHFKRQTDNAGPIMGMLQSLPENDRLQLVREVLQPVGHDLLVTPKDVDQFIEDIANIIASGLNAALHDAVDSSNVAAYTH